VFDAQGNPVQSRRNYTMVDGSDYRGSWAEYRRGYAAQVRHVNRLVEETVSAILARSASPPVIIIQGDHGPGRSSNLDRHKILNAYYLPGVPSEQLYPSISPVNSFRLVFDVYFDAGLGRLEDRSYYSVYETPYKFKEIVDDCK
jgi:hypothetical protein